jgi:hypothetical protein
MVSKRNSHNYPFELGSSDLYPESYYIYAHQDVICIALLGFTNVWLTNESEVYALSVKELCVIIGGSEDAIIVTDLLFNFQVHVQLA